MKGWRVLILGILLIGGTEPSSLSAIQTIEVGPFGDLEPKCAGKPLVDYWTSFGDQRPPKKGIAEKSDTPCSMGIDTGKVLHVVISRWDGERRRIVYLGILKEFSELDDLMVRFKVSRCVIDALPETHITRAFAGRFPGRVWLNYFNEHQKGGYRWDEGERIVQENRTEALDASRRAIRDGLVLLPRRTPLVEEFAQHLSADAKRLEEDDATGSQFYTYVRTGADHFSLAFTYDCIAWSGEPPGGRPSSVIVGNSTNEEIEDAHEESILGILRRKF